MAVVMAVLEPRAEIATELGTEGSSEFNTLLLPFRESRFESVVLPRLDRKNLAPKPYEAIEHLAEDVD
jgi:hypothetical protein